MGKYIGNIVVSSPNFKVDNCFNKCLNMSTIDITLPTLIIGLSNAKNLIDNFKILQKKYNNDMLWWTFSKNERRIDFDKDILEFHNYCINKIISNIEYHNVNYVDLSYTKCKKLIKYIKNKKKKEYYIDKNKFIFLYDIENSVNSKKIYGFSLSTAAFFGIDSRKILKILENNEKNYKIKNFYSIPNNIRVLINDDIPSEMVLNEYFY